MNKSDKKLIQVKALLLITTSFQADKRHWPITNCLSGTYTIYTTHYVKYIENTNAYNLITSAALAQVSNALLYSFVR